MSFSYLDIVFLAVPGVLLIAFIWLRVVDGLPPGLLSSPSVKLKGNFMARVKQRAQAFRKA